MSTGPAPLRGPTLAALPIGVPARVVAIDPEVQGRLGPLGFRPGVTVTIDVDAPFGGPRIVRLGSARIALARLIASEVRVERVADR